TRAPSSTLSCTTCDMASMSQRPILHNAASARRALSSSPKPTSMIVAPSRAFGDHATMVDHDDLVGETVGFFEILRRQQDRRPVVDELLDHTPQVGAA